jgi:hypothetical protein
MMNRMMMSALGTIALLAACTPTQQVATIQLAAEALPCYQAIVAASAGGSAQLQIMTAASVAALNPSCAALDQASLELIASAVNSGALVTSGPVSQSVTKARAVLR